MKQKDIPKDASYHSSAVRYNEGLAEAAEKLANEVEHPEVKKWCRSVGKQHRFHAKRHNAALARLEEGEEAKQPDETDNDENLSVAEQQARFAAEQEKVNA